MVNQRVGYNPVHVRTVREFDAMINKYFILSIIAAIIICTSIVSAANTTTNPADLNTTTNCVIFNGYYNGTVPAHVWFEFGMNQTGTLGQKSYKTPNQTRSTVGNFSFRQCGIPLLSRETYIVQAVGEFIYGENVSFTMPAPVPHVTTTYVSMVNSFVGQDEYGNNGFDPMKLLTYDVWQPYLGLMGGLFFGVILGFIFINIALKQKSVVISVILFIIVGLTIMTLLPPAFIQLGQLLFIAAIAGILYWIIMKRR
jgi:hypothetical protein